jgi:hypothetical protein
MSNLLEETKNAIGNSNHTIQDINFIGSIDPGYACSWDEFQVLADREYDSGYGSQQVASDLIIMFTDGTYLERAEYDGSEWWEYREKLNIPTNVKPITTLFAKYGWDTIADCHGEE